MKTRLITGIVLAAVLIPLLFVNELVFFIVLSLFTVLASYEYGRMLSNKYILHAHQKLYVIAMALLLYGAIITVYLSLLSSLFIILVSLIIFVSGFLLFVFDDALTQTVLSKMIIGVWYIGASFAALSSVRSLGVDVLIFLLIIAMVTDMFAYFSGMLFGKTKLAPTISPKKTVEGAIGGTLVGVIAATIYATLVSGFFIESIIVVVVVSMTVSLLAQLGDLVASKMKREHDIKDFSKLLPGHGGVLDRFDSSMFAALALFIAVLIIEVL